LQYRGEEQNVRSRVLVLVLLAAVAALGGGTTAGASVSGVVISQVYGGGGNTGAPAATLKNDFIELYNAGPTDVDLTNWSVQYASSAGTSWQVTPLTGTIPAGHHYLIREAAGTGGSVDLPPADATGSIPMSATSGKVALVQGSTTALTPQSCPAVHDFVGYGTSADCWEGKGQLFTGPTPNLNNASAALRLGNGATDTDNNLADFVVGAPNPRNVGETAPRVSSSTPAPAATGVARNSSVAVVFSEAVTTSASAFDITCASSGAHPFSFSGSGASYSLDPTTDFGSNETCTVTVTASGVTDVDADDPPDAMAADHVFTFQTVEQAFCGDPATPIPAIQGEGSTITPSLIGAASVEGVVVGDFEGATTAGLQGFYLQDPAGDGNAATSDGIFVFTANNASAVSVGQRVRVSGFARERFDQTAIMGSATNNGTGVTNILQCGPGSVTPTDVSVPFATLSFPERYEGMLVRFPQALVIAEYFNFERFGELVLGLPLAGETRPFTPTSIVEPGAPAQARLLQNQLRRITLDDGLGSQNPPFLRHPDGAQFTLVNRFRGGDTVANAVGVMGQDFGLYRIQPTGGASYTPVNPRPTERAEVGGTLQVAAMNTLNFFLSGNDPTTTADDRCGGNQNLECRGWNTDQPQEFPRQRDKLIATLAGLEANVIGLNEIENTPGVDPLGDPTRGVVAGLNAYPGAGTWARIDTGVIGTDAIRVGLIYQPAEVVPVGAFKTLTSAVDPRFIDTRSRPALAQTFEEVATGARFTVVVNHLKSKGSACAGDPDALDGQGNCNGTRTLAAQALVDWLATDPTGSGDPDFLIMGDLNSYAMEDPIDAIKAGPDGIAGTADDYTNLIAKYGGTYAYSYVFDGMAGYLDHALSGATMTPQVTGVTEWHVNADEPDIFDYDMSFKPAAQDALYEPLPYRASDHDPVIVGLDATTSYDDLRRLIRAFVANAGIENSLLAKVNAAQRAEERGDLDAKADVLNALVNELRAQSGKALTEAQAEMLIEIVSQL
jgi:hypothetical protein